MLYHLSEAWLPGGFTGVDVFFVISGFVVCGSLASSGADFRGFITGFYARRLARIIPGLVLMLSVVAILATLFIPPVWLSSLSDRTALYAFVGLSNWVMLDSSGAYFAPRAEFNPFTHTWSLGVEEQFYLGFPLLCFLWVRARRGGSSRRTRGAVTLLAGLGAASLLACVWATSAQPQAAFYMLWFRFWELATGALLYQVTAFKDASASVVTSAATLGAWVGAGGVLAGFLFADAGRFPFPWAVPAVLGTALLIGGTSADVRCLPRRLLAHGVPVWIGKRSYSLYLWHWPVYVLFRWTVGVERAALAAAAVFVTFILASLSYGWIEVPLRNNRMLNKSAPVVRITFFLLIVAGGWKVADGVLWRDQTMGLSVVSRSTVDWDVGSTMPYRDRPRQCSVKVRYFQRWGGEVWEYRPSGCKDAGDRARHVTVFGDSHALAYLPLFDQLSGESGVSVNVYTPARYIPAGCPYLDLIFPMEGYKNETCVTFWRDASAEVLAASHSGDVLFLPSLRQRRFVDPWSVVRDVESIDDIAISSEAKELTARATREAAVWLEPFIDRGIKVLFEAPKPLFKSPPFRCLDWFNAANPVCQGGLTQPRSLLQTLRQPIVDAMRELAAGSSAIFVWDPFPVLCPAETCTVSSQGRPLFIDGDHITAYANALVYPAFASTVSSLTTHDRSTATMVDR
jgi:peptidoglycan/LPS O-acetylase OafA/YrhL